MLADTNLGRNESVAENKGTGLRRMVGLMRQAGLPDPQFVDRTVEFVVVLSRFPATSHTSGRATDPRAAAITAALAETGLPLRASELVGLGNMTQRQVDRALAGLVAQGLVEPTAPPRSKNRAYRLSSSSRKTYSPPLSPRDTEV